MFPFKNKHRHASNQSASRHGGEPGMPAVVVDKVSHNGQGNALSEIQLAATNFNYVEINYRKLDDSAPSFRKVEPYMLLYSDNKWILMAWCHLRLDYRAFRVDRILHFKILSEKFEDRKFDPKTYYRANPYNSKRE